MKYNYFPGDKDVSSLEFGWGKQNNDNKKDSVNFVLKKLCKITIGAEFEILIPVETTLGRVVGENFAGVF